MASQGTTNPNIFLLPDLGEGLEEAELIEWCVTEGQDVKESDMVAKMETAKAVVEVYSPRAGTIETLHGKPGETIKVARTVSSSTKVKRVHRRCPPRTTASRQNADPERTRRRKHRPRI